MSGEESGYIFLSQNASKWSSHQANGFFQTKHIFQAIQSFLNCLYSSTFCKYLSYQLEQSLILPENSQNTQLSTNETVNSTKFAKSSNYLHISFQYKETLSRFFVVTLYIDMRNAIVTDIFTKHIRDLLGVFCLVFCNMLCSFYILLHVY